MKYHRENVKRTEDAEQPVEVVWMEKRIRSVDMATEQKIREDIGVRHRTFRAGKIVSIATEHAELSVKVLGMKEDVSLSWIPGLFEVTSYRSRESPGCHGYR